MWLDKATPWRKCRKFNAHIKKRIKNMSLNIQYKDLEKEQHNKPKESRIK
jgi:hypothetical protein